MCVCVCVCRQDSCLCHVSGMLVSEFEDDLTAISSSSDEHDLSTLCCYLTAGRGQVILKVLSITGVTVSCSVCLSVFRQVMWEIQSRIYR